MFNPTLTTDDLWFAGWALLTLAGVLWFIDKIMSYTDRRRARKREREYYRKISERD